MDQRVWAFVAGMMTVFVLAALMWLLGWFRATPPVSLPPPSPTPRDTATPTASATVAPAAAAPRGLRLAGVAEHAGQLFAVVEQPDGRHGMFRQGDDVPGLGTVLHVGGEKAVFRTAAGDVTLWVAPAPTATRTPTAPRPTFTPRAPRAASPAAGESTPRSNSSAVPDRSAS